MAKKYHISPNLGARPCDADEGNCPLGSDAPHFNTQKEAEHFYVNDLAKNNETFTNLKKSIKQEVKTGKRDYSSIEKAMHEKKSLKGFVNENKENFDLAVNYVSHRENYMKKIVSDLNKLNPYEDGAHPVSRSTFNILYRKASEYKHETNDIVNVLVSSKFKKALKDN